MKERIQQIIEYSQLTISAFEKKINVSNGTVRSAIEKDRGLSTGTLEKIVATYPEINFDWLVAGRGVMLLTDESIDVSEELPLSKSAGPSIVTVDTSENSIVPILDVKAAAGSPTILDEPDYWKALPVFSFPNFMFRGALVGVHVRGHSMTPTIHQGDYVVGRLMEDLRDLRNGEVYILIYQADQRVHITVKRCYWFQGDDVITLESDNSDYPTDQLTIPSLLKTYHVQANLTTQLYRAESPNMRRQLDRIERRIDRLEGRQTER